VKHTPELLIGNIGFYFISISYTGQVGTRQPCSWTPW
jgi:hypothetical protein